MVKIYVPTETWAPCCPVSHWDGARRRAELLQGVIPISTKEIIKYLLWGLTNGSEMSKFTNETAFLSSLVHKNSFLILFRKKNQTEEHKSEISWTWCLFFFFFLGCAGSLWCTGWVTPRLSGSYFLNQGSNPRPLQWKVVNRWTTKKSLDLMSCTYYYWENPSTFSWWFQI